MVYLLTAFGHQAIEARDGLEGIEAAKREKPDLILLDIHMPQMDGYEASRRLLADAETCRIPLVAVTALAMVGDREKILASGFSGYIAKPVDPETFPTQVQSYLGLRTLPGAMAVRAVEPVPSPATTRDAPKALALVLFVDNMQTNIDLVRSILEPSGYAVIAARSVREGVDMARAKNPNLIVSDVHMPYQDGYEFMRLLQRDPATARIPFIFLSSSVWSRQEQQRAILQGARKFISRPIDPELLLSELKELLQTTEE